MSDTLRADLLDIVTPVIDLWSDHIGTHYDGCYQRHVACLAVLIRDVTERTDAGGPE